MNDNNRFNHSFPSPTGNAATSEGQPLQPPGFPPPSSTRAEAEKGFQLEQYAPGTWFPPLFESFLHSSQRLKKKVTYPLLRVGFCRAVFQVQSCASKCGTLRERYATKKKRYLLIGSLLTLLVLLGGVVFSMWWFTKSTPDVTLYQVGDQNVNQDSGGGGIVFPRQQIDISYPTSELVKAVLVKAGDHVTPNQSLIQLDPSQLNIQIQQAAADMAAAQATLNSVSASGNALQIAQAQQSYQLAKDRYDAMVAQAASPTLRHGNLISPMSGVVTAVNVNPGAVIAANAPLLTIMDESIVIVHAKIPLANLGAVHLGQQATVTPSALPGLTMQGIVSSIIPQADPQTDTFEVWVSVNNTNQMLLPGMSAFVHIQSAGKALVVPRLAVLDPDSQAVVFVVQNFLAHLQHVQVVGRTANAIFIGQGLKAGDKVVIVGIDGLQDNQRVRVSQIEQNKTPS